jgi:hypothetical protein
MAQRKKAPVKRNIVKPLEFSDEELGFLFNLLNSEDLRVSGRNTDGVTVIKQKIIQYLQPKQRAAQERPNGNSPDAAE